jgi:hypothetical protein
VVALSPRRSDSAQRMPLSLPIPGSSDDRKKKKMTEDNLQDLAGRTRRMLETSLQKFAHIDTTSSLIAILAEAITIMRQTGADSKTIARVLSHAAGELNSRPDP